MTAQSLEGNRAMFTGLVAGNADFIRDVAAPYVGDVSAALASAGLVEATSDADLSVAFGTLPAFPSRTAIAGAGHDLMIGIGLYFSFKAVDVVVEAMLVDLYDSRIKPATSRLWATMSDRIRRRTVVRFDHWFDDPGLLVRVECKTRIHGGEPQFDLVSEAVRRALAAVDQQGLTHRVLTFVVLDGELQDKVERTCPL